MNSNRTRYSSAPTYGMQKHGLGKKQAAAQQPTAPDFSQLPPQEQPPFIPQPMLPNQPLPFQAGVPFQPPVNPYMPMGQSLLQSQGAPVQPMPFIPNLYTQPQGNQPNFAAVPIPQLPQPTQTPANQPAQGKADKNGVFSARQQGYVPEPIPMATSTVIPAAALNQGFDPNAAFAAMAGQPPTYPPQPVIPQGYTPQSPAYASAPMQQNTLNGLQPSGMPTPPQMPQRPPRKPIGKDGWARIFLFCFLPILFVVCLMPGTPDFLKYAFMILTILTMGAVWYIQLFSPSARSTITIVAVALCIILVILLVSSEDRTRQVSASDTDPPISAQTTVSPEDSAQPLAPPQDVSVMEEVASESAAGVRLSAFMELWKNSQVEDMVALVQPSWASTLEKPANNLFILLGNRTPTEYEIISITGAAVDSSRTITMDATISKNNNSTPVKYRFLILMVKVDEQWYVDPNSLTSNDLETPTPSVSIREPTLNPDSPRTTTTPVPDPSTKLYYNAKGHGSYYHLDPECSAVNEKWLPLDSFLYSEIGEAPYKSLLPCLKCGAPLAPED